MEGGPLPTGKRCQGPDDNTCELLSVWLWIYFSPCTKGELSPQSFTVKCLPEMVLIWKILKQVHYVNIKEDKWIERKESCING